ncbi:MAG: hypothetical protein M0P01_00895, partial [Treponema sp.]|nr:hypothetical protein [Treponema sp.]
MITTADSTAVYVSGDSPSHLAAGNDSTGDGSFAKPYASLAKALATVTTSSKAQTIYIDGTLTETEQTVDGSAAGYCEQIVPADNLTLSIIGIDGAAVLDASSVSSSTSSVELLSVTGGSNYTVNLTLNGLTLKCPAGTSASLPGCGVHTTSSFGTGSSLTLQNCTITTDSVYTCPVYTVAADGSDLALTLSGSTVIAASDTGNAALSTAGSVTIASSDISVTGILTAGAIVVNAVPSSPITVEPFSSPTGSAVMLFASDSTQAVSGCISSFPLWDTTDYYYTDSFTVMSVQTLTTEYRKTDGYNYVNITTKRGQISVPVTDLTDTYLATTIGSNGEIYVVYYDPSGESGCYCVFYAGVAGAFIISGLSGAPAKLALCQVSDGLLLSTGLGSLYKLTSSTTTDGTTTWTGTSVNVDSSLSDTSFTSVYTGGTQYVFYSYTDTTTNSSDGPYIPMLGCAVLSDGTLTKKWVEPVSLTTVSDSASVSGLYSSSVCITDMAVGLDGKLYMLLSDTSDKADFLLNSSMYLTSRGALICAGSAQSLASDTSPSSLSLTPYGWRAGANGTTPCTAYGYESSVISIYASSSATYEDDQYFAGSGRFLCLTPKQITMADSGIYVADGTSWTTKYGTAVFTLDGSVLDLSIATSESESVSLYGVFGSGSITTSSSSY